MSTLRADIARFFATCNSDARRSEAIEHVEYSPEARIILTVALERFVDCGNAHFRSNARKLIQRIRELS